MNGRAGGPSAAVTSRMVDFGRREIRQTPRCCTAPGSEGFAARHKLLWIGGLPSRIPLGDDHPDRQQPGTENDPGKPYRGRSDRSLFAVARHRQFGKKILKSSEEPTAGHVAPVNERDDAAAGMRSRTRSPVTDSAEMFRRHRQCRTAVDGGGSVPTRLNAPLCPLSGHALARRLDVVRTPVEACAQGRSCVLAPTSTV